jgi:hypothetical protein
MEGLLASSKAEKEAAVTFGREVHVQLIAMVKYTEQLEEVHEHLVHNVRPLLERLTEQDLSFAPLIRRWKITETERLRTLLDAGLHLHNPMEQLSDAEKFHIEQSAERYEQEYMLSISNQKSSDDSPGKRPQSSDGVSREISSQGDMRTLFSPIPADLRPATSPDTPTRGLGRVMPADSCHTRSIDSPGPKRPRSQGSLPDMLKAQTMTRSNSPGLDTNGRRSLSPKKVRVDGKHIWDTKEAVTSPFMQQAAADIISSLHRSSPNITWPKILQQIQIQLSVSHQAAEALGRRAITKPHVDSGLRIFSALHLPPTKGGHMKTLLG